MSLDDGDNRRRQQLLLAFGVFAVFLAIQIVTEHLMGRVWICSCGEIKLWENQIYAPGNSQHLADWYTPSHIIHGFLFYGLGWLIFRKKALPARVGLAMLIESGWEILENTPLIINRYRAETISLDYLGDSILNSTMDTIFMAIGFILASRLPLWLTIVIALAFELFTGYMVRDNLTLNVLMLVWPLEAVREWQGATAP
jgi:hypothetical protein